jgi:flavin reductase (DIM6/NTAB) family NADH-FMN oxidoreductase RutF
MRTFDSQDIEQMERRYRGNFVNSLSGYKSANLIGTTNQHGQHNLAIVSSVFHLGANPALIGFIHRPTTVERHTYENILETGVYTINAVSSDYIAQAHQTSARYERHESEFEQCHFTPEFIAEFQAPFVKESPLVMGVELIEAQPIQHNETHLMIGKIIHVRIADEKLLHPDGAMNIVDMRLACVAGLDGYAVPESYQRFSYAKPDEALQQFYP